MGTGESVAVVSTDDFYSADNAADVDTPPVNRAEGRVLLEMRHAMAEFARANALNKSVPKLVPGAGTRSVLGAKRSNLAATGKGAAVTRGCGNRGRGCGNCEPGRVTRTFLLAKSP